MHDACGMSSWHLNAETVRKSYSKVAALQSCGAASATRDYAIRLDCEQFARLLSRRWRDQAKEQKCNDASAHDTPRPQ